MEQENTCFNFSKNNDVFCRFCWINVSNYMIFVGQLIFVSLIHFLDIGFDIYVLNNIYNHDDREFFYQIFYISLGILMLSFISASIPTNSKSNLGILIEFFIGLTQIKFLIIVYESLIAEEFKERLIKLRLDEALIESTFQSLLQLYILLQYETYSQDVSNFDLIIYYLSISFSLISVAYTMVSYEIETFNNIYLIRSKKDKSNKKYSYGTNKLSILSSYGICLSCFRITEVFSRIGLLAYFGEVKKINDVFRKYNLYGYHIILAIVIDFFMANFFEIILYFRNNNRESIYSFLKNFVNLLTKIFHKIKYMAVYYEPFCLEYLKKDCENLEESSDDIELNLEISNDYLCIPFKNMHFISKFINNLIIIGFLIDEIVNVENLREVFIASILYTITFSISNILLYFIWLWNSEREIYASKFKPW